MLSSQLPPTLFSSPITAGMFTFFTCHSVFRLSRVAGRACLSAYARRLGSGAYFQAKGYDREVLFLFYLFHAYQNHLRLNNLLYIHTHSTCTLYSDDMGFGLNNAHARVTPGHVMTLTAHLSISEKKSTHFPKSSPALSPHLPFPLPPFSPSLPGPPSLFPSLPAPLPSPRLAPSPIH